jgi:hypothetical protein
MGSYTQKLLRCGSRYSSSARPARHWPGGLACHSVKATLFYNKRIYYRQHLSARIVTSGKSTNCRACITGHWETQLTWVQLGMKTDRIRTDITDIVFVFVFMSGFGFEYG